MDLPFVTCVHNLSTGFSLRGLAGRVMPGCEDRPATAWRLAEHVGTTSCVSMPNHGHSGSGISAIVIGSFSLPFLRTTLYHRPLLRINRITITISRMTPPFNSQPGFGGGGCLIGLM